MTRELEEKLFEKYPKIFSGKDEPIIQNLMPFGFECGDGWFWLIDTMCDHIQSYIDLNGLDQIKALQVKEKYGTLRFYYSYGNEKIDGIVSHTEWLSGHTCEYCGSTKDVGITTGWNVVMCHEDWMKSDYKEFHMDGKYFIKEKDGSQSILTDEEYDNR